MKVQFSQSRNCDTFSDKEKNIGGNTYKSDWIDLNDFREKLQLVFKGWHRFYR
jgi:hypothetical protein